MNDLTPQRLMDDLPTPVVCVLNDENFTIKYANPAAVALVGYNLEDFLDNKRYNGFTLIHPDDLWVPDRHAEVLAANGVCKSRYRVVASDGTAIPVLDVSRPWVEDGKAIGIITVLVDLRDTPELIGPAKVFDPAP